MEIGSTQINTTMSNEERLRLENEVRTFNRMNEATGRKVDNSLGKDDFLKLLITQLTNQNPMNPLQDTQFIAQMAQFSSLEQITNMNESLGKMTAKLNSERGISTLGKVVELDLGNGESVTGVVEKATLGENPEISVGNIFYDMSKIKAIYEN